MPLGRSSTTDSANSHALATALPRSGRIGVDSEPGIREQDRKRMRFRYDVDAISP